MRRLFATLAALVAIAGAALSLAAPTHAGPSAAAATGGHTVTVRPVTAHSVPVQAGTSDAAGTPAPTGTSSPSATPSEPPANPGTGEPAESEANRLNWAPYVIGAVLIITALIIFVWRRRRGNKTMV